MVGYEPLSSSTPLPDKRLQTRLEHMLDCFSASPDSTIPEATSDRNHMDAAYNFFKNERVSPPKILASCLNDTLDNLDGCDRVLVVQDTVDHNFSALEQTTGLGYTDGHQTRGLKQHAALAVRPDGLVAGLLTQQTWARPFSGKGKAAKRRQRDAQDKESYRWQDHACAARSVLPESMTVVHIADREADIYQWFACERPANTHLLVRVAQANRVVVHGPDGASSKLGLVVAAQPVLGQHVITVPRADERPTRQATLSIRVAFMELEPPRHAKNRSQLPRVPVWVIEAREENPPAGATPVHWRLVSTEAINSLEEAIRGIAEYVLRWLIERYHFTIKSGFQVEQLQLTTAERLANALAVYSQAAVRVMRLTYLGRSEPESEASREFRAEELEVLQAERDRRTKRSCGPVVKIGEAVVMVAKLGGHLGRKGDGPPGLKVLWRGLKALHNLTLGFLHGLNASRLTNNYP